MQNQKVYIFKNVLEHILKHYIYKQQNIKHTNIQ